MPKNKKLYCPNCQKEQNYVTDYIAGKQALAKYCAVCDTHIEEKYKFCILAAGKGTRNTSVEGLHKAVKGNGYCDACFTNNYPIKKRA